ncbi:MAG: urease accessory protein UreE [Deltaproteobacteria bacterium]|jgi:urease accessory protein|nr:urease accessory protein UreE [Deltaproteobacteria bacterium]
MLNLTKIAGNAKDGRREGLRLLLLDHESRRKVRKLVTLEDGERAALRLPRGTRLKDGDLLSGDSGEVVMVAAEPEELMEAKARNVREHAAAVYHLGNRHVPVEIAEDLTLRFSPSPVLKTLLESLNLEVREIEAPFEPLFETAVPPGHVHDDPSGSASQRETNPRDPNTRDAGPPDDAPPPAERGPDESPFGNGAIPADGPADGLPSKKDSREARGAGF